MYELAVSAFHHPDPVRPYRGLFNKRSIEALADHEDCSLNVCTPIPYVPPVGPYSEYWSVGDNCSFDKYTVSRPRFLYLLPKSIFHAATGELFAYRLHESLVDDKIDIYHGCHAYPDGYGLYKATHESGQRFTTTCHGHYLNNISKLAPGVATRVKRTLEAAGHVFCVSDALKKKAESLSEKIETSTVPIGADPTNFPDEDEPKFRKKYGIKQDTTVILYCGQFIERKGIKDIIQLFDKFPSKDVEYVLVGHSGDLFEEMNSVAKGSSHDVRVLRGISTAELREWYVLADLFFLPSYQEGRPTAIYEAMAAQTAVLSTRVGGVAEQVKEGETGQLVTPGDQEEILNHLREMTGNTRELRQMGEAAKKRLISKGWTWEEHANRIVEAHQRLL